MEAFRRLVIKVSTSLGRALLVFAGSLLVAALLFLRFERDLNFFDAIYWAVVTSTTTGFGDISPESVGGRLTFIVSSLFWVFYVLPVIIGNVAQKIFRSKDEFTHAEQEWIMTALQTIADTNNIELPRQPSDTNFVYNLPEGEDE
jgi:voltage-gated potassium channel